MLHFAGGPGTCLAFLRCHGVRTMFLTLLCCTQPQSRAQTCLPFRPGPGPSPTGQVFPRMASTTIVDSIGGENSACHDFRGMYFLIPSFGNGQTIKIVYDRQQLQMSLYPAFKSAFRAHGFDEVPWEDVC